jgi:hypothetical protein
VATRGDDGTADLLDALRQTCPDVADEAFEAVAALLGGPPAGVGPEGADAETRLRWQSLTLGQIPGLAEVLSAVSSPLQVIAAVLDFVAGILEILSALLIDLLDPFRALILAAYEILRAIVEDLLASGAYLYADVVGLDVPTLTRPAVPAAADAAPWVPGGPPLALPPGRNGFEAWASRFRASFDDPGDLARPVFSDGAPVEAVFVVGTAPDVGGLGGLLTLLEKIFDVGAFPKAWQAFSETFPARPPDPSRTRARTTSVAPDWKSWRLRDIAPPDYPLEKLLWLPWLLKALLLNTDSIIGLLRNLAAAVKEKAAMLRGLVAILQAIIDAIRALSATGLHVLAVVTDEGVEGLTTAFLEAEDRPNTDDAGNPLGADLVAGVCLLAGTSGAVPANALPIWSLLGQQRTLEQAYSGLVADGQAIAGQAQQALADTVAMATGAWHGSPSADSATPLGQGAARQAAGLWEELKATAGEQYGDVLALLGMDEAQAEELSRRDAESLATAVAQVAAEGARLDPRVLAHIEAARRAGGRGNRSLAAALGLRSASAHRGDAG